MAAILSGFEAVMLSLLYGIVKRAIEFHDWNVAQWITLLIRYISYIYMFKYTTVRNQSKVSLHGGDLKKKNSNQCWSHFSSWKIVLCNQ